MALRARKSDSEKSVKAICGSMMENNVILEDTGHRIPLTGPLDTQDNQSIPSTPTSSLHSPPSLHSSLPPARPSRPKPPHPGAKSSQLHPCPPPPPSTPPSLTPHFPSVAKPPLLPSSNLAPTPLPPPLSPILTSPSPLLSLQPTASSDPTPSLTPLPSPPPLFSTMSPIPAIPPSSSIPSLLSPIDRLVGSASVWQPKGVSQDQTRSLMEKEMAGAFLVYSEEDKGMTLSVRLPDETGGPLIHNLIVKQLKTFVHITGSCLVFDDIFKLISFYCTSRDILAIPLRLPHAIATATKREELEVISAMGADFWTSDLNQQTTKPDLVLDQNHTRFYMYVNPINVEESQSKDLKQSSVSFITNITNENISSSLQNGGASEVVSPEVKGPTKITSNKEIKYKRPPPRPPSLSSGSGVGLLFSSPPSPHSSSSTTAKKKEEGSGGTGEREKRKPMSTAPPPLKPPVPQQSRATPPLPPAPLCRTSSRKTTARDVGPDRDREKGQTPAKKSEQETGGEGEQDKTESESSLQSEIVEQANNRQLQDERVKSDIEVDEKQKKEMKIDKEDDKQKLISHCAPLGKKPFRPVPPPRRKLCSPGSPVSALQVEEELPDQSAGIRVPLPSPAQRLDMSLYSPQGSAVIGTDNDSCSTSSTEEEGDLGQEQEQNLNHPDSRSPKIEIKRTPTTIILDRARYRLSTVITGLINHDHRLTQRIVELARDPLSYFGNLVKEHRAFTLDTISKHSTSTELLQEIRQMMTQLKSYLLQSTELKSMLEQLHQYAQDKLESIVEAALCKSVLKPLREPIYKSLENLHTSDSSLKQLTQNQSVVLGSTTTALGITTAVPEAPVMEKISIKLNSLHLEYSPQKKIELLLKSCKIIYNSMSLSSPGRTHGADDFLPVMMYVLARSNLSYLQLDVEYMMELMDPSLALGEGSYYLTSTYGALEHIKTFDHQQSATRQLSREVQDSIHRWERRRTLNQERVAQESVRDFLTVSCPESGTNSKTLGVLPTTTMQQLAEQCAERFEKDSYILRVYIDGVHRPLAPTELAVSVKNSCQHGSYSFVYHPIDQPINQCRRSCPTDAPPAPPAEAFSTADIVSSDSVDQDTEEESLISL